MVELYRSALKAACLEAQRFIGATSPNPPVGAAGLDKDGGVLSIQAHQRAGSPHAEALVLEDCRARGLLSALQTLVVTLEPCNHQGRTPACTHAILNSPVSRVVYSCHDPNPQVTGQGAEFLRSRGIQVLQMPETECDALLEAFSHWCHTGLPWVTVKTAHDDEGSMIPAAGTKTFTSVNSLRFAHELRKRADAILTGSGTILADEPEFTVRHVPDHPGKKRRLVVMDRRGRTPSRWVELAESRGFLFNRGLELLPVLRKLGEEGAREVLVEAGPTLSASVLASGLWNRHVLIRKAPDGEKEDRIEIRNHVHGNH